MGFLVYAYGPPYPKHFNGTNIEKRVFYEKDAISLAEGLQKKGKCTHVGVIRLHSVALWEWERSWPSPIVRK